MDAKDEGKRKKKATHWIFHMPAYCGNHAVEEAMQPRAHEAKDDHPIDITSICFIGPAMP
jgi:hypothetical protein